MKANDISIHFLFPSFFTNRTCLKKKASDLWPSSPSLQRFGSQGLSKLSKASGLLCLFPTWFSHGPYQSVLGSHCLLNPVAQVRALAEPQWIDGRFVDVRLPRVWVAPRCIIVWFQLFYRRLIPTSSSPVELEGLWGCKLLCFSSRWRQLSPAKGPRRRMLELRCFPLL